VNPDLAPLLYRELEKIAEHPDWSPREQVLALAGLMERLFFEATKQEQIAFSSLFARISYVGHQFHFQEDTLRRVHGFRLTAKRVRGGQVVTEAMVHLGLRAVREAVGVMTGGNPTPDPGNPTPDPSPTGRGGEMPTYTHSFFSKTSKSISEDISPPLPSRERSGVGLPGSGEGLPPLRSARLLALRDDPDHNCLIARDEENPERLIRIRYALPERNENFMPTIQVIRKVFGFPVALNLLDVDIDSAGDYRPRAIVVEPDYLVDVSAIAECFKDTGPEPYAYLAKKFLPYETTEAILLGNIANFFLDRLLNEPSAEWQSLFRETFQIYPFAYAPMTDSEVRSVSGKAQKHYLNLKNMASGGLAKQGIEPEDCVLEPTFFSEQYGIQGRLDLFYRTDERAAIVELKSGTPFKPNSYGIQRSHFTQTLLYDLLVRSVFGHATDPAKYILYSGVDVNHLRFAPTVAPEQWEALQVRNQLVALERLLTKIKPGDESVSVFGRLRAAKGQGFMERDFAQFETAYSGLSVLEKKYFNAFTGFIAREHWLAKVGEENTDTLSGHASLWRGSFDDKQQAFSILSHLEIAENRADQPEPCIVFRKTDRTNPLANFRVGDIAVLYPALEDTDTVLHHQVIKCTITELAADQVTVQPRFRQFNLKPFDTEGLWHLEPDTMDMGFAAMYRGLLEWAGASVEVRRRVMGLSTPDPSNPTPDPSPNGRGGVMPSEMSSKIPAHTHESSAKPSEGASEDIMPPLPLGEGSGVGLRKTGSFGAPQETTPLDRWAYLKNFARLHRKYPTEAESILWEQLRGKRFQGIKFRRQHAIDEYIVDFVSLEYRLAVEVDGEAHALQAEYDEQRTEYLGWFGFAVIRFTNEEVMQDMEAVRGKLAAAIEKRKGELEGENQRLTPDPGNPTPDPSPNGRGGEMSSYTHKFFSKISEGVLEHISEDISPPLPLGEGSGVGLPGPGVGLITASPHYFLLWGPPGTGKTSVMLRDLAAWILQNTADNLLLLAYTNRAVDEICEALDSIAGDIRSHYLRIGGKYATAPRFREQLLSTKIAGAKNRAELRAVLDQHRIFVSTVASFGQNDGLLRLKKFQRLIVDEASQILEPQIIGLLTRFDHFVLIGDHRQLPAVTAQRTEATAVSDPDLLSIGLTDMRDSYFERLYRRCQEQGWHWAYGQLDRQGRMHRDIMDFPNRHFYGGQLKPLVDDDPQHRQHQPLWYDLPGFDPFLEKTLAERRVVFLPTEPEETTPGQKTNRTEAQWAARIALFFKKLYALNGKAWHPNKTLGIITPWRAQIAQIRASLSEAGLDPDDITTDTVERYQGGAREIIILSTCVNSEHQLGSLVNLSSEGVDRKLNVALTRAREHVVVLGNEEILKQDERYRTFIEAYRFGGQDLPSQQQI